MEATEIGTNLRLQCNDLSAARALDLSACYSFYLTEIEQVFKSSAIEEDEYIL
ncbi:unnamed protein product, partial [Rotaria sp. Silwood2]